MKMIFPFLMLINLSCFAQDTLPVFTNEYFNYLIEWEIKCCKSAKNQLRCVDSLIQVTRKNIDYLGKGNEPKKYFDQHKKLLLYSFYAGNISGLRGDLEQSLAHFKQMDIYFDTLSKNNREERFIDLQYEAHYQKIEFCSKAYREDSVLFNRCNCMQFFPETKDESVMSDTVAPPTENQKLEVKYPNWGEFYINDTLRINKRFVSDSLSIVYFKTFILPVIQTKLLQNSYYYEMLGDPSIHINGDTLIYKLSTNYEKGKLERKCELVFTSSPHPEWFDYTMLQISNLEFPVFIKDLEIYIPIVMSTEKRTNNQIYVHDDHFRIEIMKIPRIDPK